MSKIMTFIVVITAILCFAVTLAGFSVGLYYLLTDWTVHWWFPVSVALLSLFDCIVIYVGKKAGK